MRQLGHEKPFLFFLSRSEEHTSELQSLAYLVCRLLLEKKKHMSELGADPGTIRVARSGRPRLPLGGAERPAALLPPLPALPGAGARGRGLPPRLLGDPA